MRFWTPSAIATQAFGQFLAAYLRAGDLLLLEGDLGSGKTTLTRGLAAGLGLFDPVQSPSFTLLMEHEPGAWPDDQRERRVAIGLPQDPLGLDHFDAYRLRGALDWVELGFLDYPLDDHVAVIEWPSRVESALPERSIRLGLKDASASPGDSPEALDLLDCSQRSDVQSQLGNQATPEALQFLDPTSLRREIHIVLPDPIDDLDRRRFCALEADLKTFVQTIEDGSDSLH